MGFKTKLQCVDRPTNQSFYAIIPTALAQSFEREKAEDFEWIVVDKNTLIFRRCTPKKNAHMTFRRLD